MAGRGMTLRRGEYRLAVPKGTGPAGVRRSDGDDIAFDIDGGWRTFEVADREDVWFWWRGEHRHRGVTLERVGRRPRARRMNARSGVAPLVHGHSDGGRAIE
jgi:hypothetical protein